VGSVNALVIDVDYFDLGFCDSIESVTVTLYGNEGGKGGTKTISIPGDGERWEKFKSKIEPPPGYSKVMINISAKVEWGFLYCYRQTHHYKIVICDNPSGVNIRLDSEYRVSNPDDTKVRVEVMGGKEAHDIGIFTIYGFNKCPHRGNDKTLEGYMAV
jgi:hypothetical protein